MPKQKKIKKKEDTIKKYLIISNVALASFTLSFLAGVVIDNLKQQSGLAFAASSSNGKQLYCTCSETGFVQSSEQATDESATDPISEPSEEAVTIVDDVTNGLVAHWTMDKNTVSDSTVYDTSVSGHDGKLIGYSSPDTTYGMVGEALRFNGKNQYVEVVDKRDFSVPTTGELTLSAWIRPDVLQFKDDTGSGYVNILGKGEPGTHEWVLRMYSKDNEENRPNRISFYVFNNDGGLGVGSYVQDSVSPGEWIHITAKVANGRTYIYKNGNLRDSDTYEGKINTQNSSAPLRIGTRNLASYFEGGIDDVRIYNRELTSEEITKIYQLGLR